MTLYYIKNWSCPQDKERIGKTERATFWRGDILKYQTDDGEEVKLGKVQKAIPIYNEELRTTEMYYTVNDQEYCIVDEEIKD